MAGNMLVLWTLACFRTLRIRVRVRRLHECMAATDRRLRRTRLILYLASGYCDWAILMLKNQVFSGLFGGVTFFIGVVLVQELWTVFSF